MISIDWKYTEDGEQDTVGTLHQIGEQLAGLTSERALQIIGPEVGSHLAIASSHFLLALMAAERREADKRAVEKLAALRSQR